MALINNDGIVLNFGIVISHDNQVSFCYLPLITVL